MSVSNWSVATLGPLDGRRLTPVGASLYPDMRFSDRLPSLPAAATVPYCHLLIPGSSGLSLPFTLRRVRKTRETTCKRPLVSVVTIRIHARVLTRFPEPPCPSLRVTIGITEKLPCREELKLVCPLMSPVGHCRPTVAPRGSQESWPCTDRGLAIWPAVRRGAECHIRYGTSVRDRD